MVIRFFFQNINKEDKDRLEKYFYEKKLAGIKKLLQHGNLELAKFALNVKYHIHRKVFIVRLGLRVAKKDLTSEEGSQNLIEAFDLALGDLTIQLRKLESKIHDK
jgi:ribosome-associated translation inhibitor RaiA